MTKPRKPKAVRAWMWRDKHGEHHFTRTPWYNADLMDWDFDAVEVEIPLKPIHPVRERKRGKSEGKE